MKISTKDIYLHSLTFNEPPYLEDEKKHLPMQFQIASQMTQDPSQGLVSCRVTGTLSAADWGEIFSVVYEGVFEVAKVLTKKNRDMSKGSPETVAHCTEKIYPYLRETIADLTRKTRMTGALSLPVDFNEFGKPVKTETIHAAKEENSSVKSAARKPAKKRKT